MLNAKRIEEIRVNQEYAKHLIESGSVYKYDKWLENYILDTNELLDEVQRLKYEDSDALIKADAEYRAEEIMREANERQKS